MQWELNTQSVPAGPASQCGNLGLRHWRCWPALIVATILSAGCSHTAVTGAGQGGSRLVCDSYVVFEMCVQDLVTDGSVDLVYFSNSKQVFMYREGMKETVAAVMPLHPCALELDEELQVVTNRILARDQLTLGEKFGIKRMLLSSYLAAKPDIDACNARVRAAAASEDNQAVDFYMGESDWDDESSELLIGGNELNQQ